MNRNRIVKQHNTNHTHGTYILTSSFRILDNHALYHLVTTYKTHNIVIYYKYRNNERHDQFFIKVCENLIQKLELISTVAFVDSIDLVYPHIQGDIILDTGYLKEEKHIEELLIKYANSSNYGYTCIESNICVPVNVTSFKEEYSARTIRNKIHKQLRYFIDPVMEDYEHTIDEVIALKNCQSFIKNKLPFYHLKNHPEFEYTSNLSVYLKYGIISPIRIYIMLENVSNPNQESFLDELIVRRELSYNFVYYNENYDVFQHITYPWAYQTMEQHKFDTKEYIYTIDDYIQFKTHDPYFNTAMKEMVYLGKMHGYMRMYWCKKIIEWSRTFKEAYDTSIYLNNHYFLDGYTPNGFAGVAWCFGKHDRAWNEREIFGKLRYMNDKGLKRKFDMEAYIKKVNESIKAYE